MDNNLPPPQPPLPPQQPPASADVPGSSTAGGDDNNSATITDFVRLLESYVPTIPDPVVAHHLRRAGVLTDDPRIIRLIALAAQKFITEICQDAFQHCKMRGGAQSTDSKKKGKDSGSSSKRYVFSLEDLVPVLKDHGISVSKPQYFA